MQDFTYNKYFDSAVKVLLLKKWICIRPPPLHILYFNTQACWFDLRLSVSGAMPVTPVLWCHQFFSSVLYEKWCHHSAPCPMIRSREMWGHCSFPKRNINHRETRVQSKAGLCSEWIGTSETHGPEKIMSLPFWFNHGVGLILQQCDTLITMISTRATYVYSICWARAQHLTHSWKTSVQNVMHLRVSLPNYKKNPHLALALFSMPRFSETQWRWTF